MGFLFLKIRGCYGFKSRIIKSSDVSKWCEYKGADGDVQAEFKVHGIAYKPFQVAIERAGNQISSKGYDVMVKDEDAKLYHELNGCMRAHLIEDWKGVVFAEIVDGKTVESESHIHLRMPQSFLILVILVFQSGYSLKNRPRRFRKTQTRTRL